MDNLDKKDIIGLGRAAVKGAEKREKDPTWVTNLEIDEFRFKPRSVIFMVLSEMGCPIRYESTTVDVSGKKINEHIGVYVDDPRQKQNVENIQNAVLEDEEFEELERKSMKLKAEEIIPPGMVKEKVREIIDRKLHEHPEWWPRNF